MSTQADGGPPQADDCRERTARRIMRQSGHAGLSTILVRNGSGWPYGSLVQVALDQAGNPLLLISDLADHSRNLKADPRLCLLFDGAAGYDQPLAGPRVSVLAEVSASSDDALLARFLRYHPGAEIYAGFADFRLYRTRVSSAHLVSGFGEIHWLEGDQLLLDCAGSDEIWAAETGIVAHMNQDHEDALQLIASRILQQDGDRWRLCGLDPEGFDLASGQRRVRGHFKTRVENRDAARSEFVRLTRAARDQAAVDG